MWNTSIVKKSLFILTPTPTESDKQQFDGFHHIFMQIFDNHKNITGQIEEIYTYFYCQQTQ